MMRAAYCAVYGGPEDVEVVELPIPKPTPDQVRIQVRAASLNLSDWEGLTGQPLYSRIGGLWRPRHTTPGSDVAGVVDAVGEQVSDFTTGDEVFGDLLGTNGAFAEYVCAPTRLLVKKPADLSFEDAACLPQAGVIALRGIVDRGDLARGKRVLINGAGGGSGMFAIQLAKAAGAHVTGVDNEGKQEFMRALGADRVIDYRREDFCDGSEHYHLILDLVAHRPMGDYRRALAPGGRYWMVGGGMRQIFALLLVESLRSRFSDKRLALLGVDPRKDDLVRVADLAASGELQVHIARRFSLQELPEAMRCVGDGRLSGKGVVLPAGRRQGADTAVSDVHPSGVDRVIDSPRAGTVSRVAVDAETNHAH